MDDKVCVLYLQERLVLMFKQGQNHMDKKTVGVKTDRLIYCREYIKVYVNKSFYKHTVL